MYGFAFPMPSKAGQTVQTLGRTSSRFVAVSRRRPVSFNSARQCISHHLSAQKHVTRVLGVGAVGTSDGFSPSFSKENLSDTDILNALIYALRDIDEDRRVLRLSSLVEVYNVLLQASYLQVVEVLALYAQRYDAPDLVVINRYLDP